MDGQLIRIVTGLSGVTYNSALAPMKPERLDDFLKPQWKGKIASTPYSAGFDVLLAEDVWGKEKTVNYVRALSKQITGLIRCGEAERIATGEYLALVMDCTGQDALQWQEKGAPLEQMMPLDAAQQRYYYFAVPKNAQHPDAAKLYTLFPMTEEGQKLAYDTWKTDLHFLPGSKMGKMVDDYKKQGVKFKEVTVDWYGQHPEIDAGKSELIKISDHQGMSGAGNHALRMAGLVAASHPASGFPIAAPGILPLCSRSRPSKEPSGGAHPHLRRASPVRRERAADKFAAGPYNWQAIRARTYVRTCIGVSTLLACRAASSRVADDRHSARFHVFLTLRRRSPFALMPSHAGRGHARASSSSAIWRSCCG